MITVAIGLFLAATITVSAWWAVPMCLAIVAAVAMYRDRPVR